MVWFPTTRTTGRSRLRGDRPAPDPASPLIPQVAGGSPLPRHLLVVLAGISGDVIALQQDCEDTPRTHATLGVILGRLDVLVDSIYQRTEDPVIDPQANDHPPPGTDRPDRRPDRSRMVAEEPHPSAGPAVDHQ